MTQLAVASGVLGLAAVGFSVWQTRWHRWLESTFRRIPLRVRAPGRKPGTSFRPR